MRIRNPVPPEHRVLTTACGVAVASSGLLMWAGITLGEHHALAGHPRPAPVVTRYVTQVADAPYPVPGPAVTHTAYVHVPGPVITRYARGPAVTVTRDVQVPGPAVTVTVTQTVTVPASAPAGSPP